MNTQVESRIYYYILESTDLKFALNKFKCELVVAPVDLRH